MLKSGRRLLAAAAASVGIALIVSGCSSGGASTTSSTPTAGGSVTYAVDTPFLSFDPNVDPAAQDARVMRQVFDSLVDLNNGKLVPWLAKSWKTSSDGLTYTFNLRTDVKFQDGTPFNAAAVCYNFDRIKDPATKSLYAISLIGPYKSCQAQGDSTVVVTLSSPFTPFLYNMSSPFLGMVSPTAAKAEGVSGFGIKPVGTGPFSFVSYTPNNSVVLKRNPDYNWAPSTAKHQGPAHIQNLTFQIISDPTVRIGSLRNGNVQGAGVIPPQQVSSVKSDTSLTYYAEQQSGEVFQLFLNTEHTPLNDPAVRKAIVQAMDVKSAVSATYFGAYAQATAPLSPTTAGYSSSVKPLAFDASAAKAALTAAGWVPGPDGIRVKDGKKLQLTYIETTPDRDSRQEIAQFLKKNLQDVGIGVTIKLYQGAQGVAIISSGSYDIAGTSFVAVDPDILSESYSSTYKSTDLAKTSNFDQQLVAAQQKPSGAARSQMYTTLQQNALDNAYSVPIYVPTYTLATTNKLKGLRFDAAAYPIFYDVYLSK